MQPTLADEGERAPGYLHRGQGGSAFERPAKHRALLGAPGDPRPWRHPDRVKLRSYADLLGLRTIHWLRQRKQTAAGADVPPTAMPSVRRALSELLDLDLWTENERRPARRRRPQRRGPSPGDRRVRGSGRAALLGVTAHALGQLAGALRPPADLRRRTQPESGARRDRGAPGRAVRTGSGWCGRAGCPSAADGARSAPPG